MNRLKKTMRRKRQRRQRSRRFRLRSKTRRQRGGLAVPPGSLVGVSLGGEYGVPVLLTKETYEKEKDREGLED
jgi:hypothetical protein